MSRVYLQLEVDFDDDEKVARLARFTRPGEARACRDLLVSMWRYCKREKSDGHVPIEMIGKLAYPDSPRIGQRDADRLVEVGICERTADGYYFPQYLKRNKSRAQLEAEAKVKAEAGRKGGQRSGVVRRVEASSQAADEAERSTLLQPSEAIDRDRDKGRDRDKDQDLGGQRPETLPPSDATKPPPGQRPTTGAVEAPTDARCTKHRGVREPGPCAGCRAARELAEQRADRAADQAGRAAEAAARACTRCDGVWVVDPKTSLPTRHKCDHRSKRSA